MYCFETKEMDKTADIDIVATVHALSFTESFIIYAEAFQCLIL